MFSKQPMFLGIVPGTEGLGFDADYDLSAFTTTDDARFWIGLGFSLVCITAAVLTTAFKKTRLIGFGLLWFLITLLPTSNLLILIGSIFAERFLYLPATGFAIAAGALAFGIVIVLASTSLLSVSYSQTATSTPIIKPKLDTKAYDERLLALAER